MNIYKSFSENFWNVRATLGSISPSEFCTLCDCGCEGVAVTWEDIGSTPPAWSEVGVVDASGWAGDTSDLSGTYTATRGANENWTTPHVSGLNRIGIKYTYDEPCTISHALWTLADGSTGSKRMAVVVQLEDDSYEVMDNYVNSTPAPTSIERNITFATRTVKAILFLGLSSHGPSTPLSIAETTAMD